MAQNYALKYSDKVDERFTRESQAMIATNKDYDWNGVKSIKVYQVDTVPLTDYDRDGANNRYGLPSNLGNTIETFTIRKDRSFTFLIDKGDKLQSMMIMDAGKSLAREQREVIIPEIDTYTFGTMADGARQASFEDDGTTPKAVSHAVVGAISSATAYAKFLKASEVLGNANVPDSGRVAFCSYAFANLLMLDPAFIKYSDKSQEMVIKGILGEVDGTKIVKVPASRLPIGCSFLIAHPMATVTVEQLNEYKIHEDAPGYSGWLVEGRMIYDSFVLRGKQDALYVHFGTGELGAINARVGATATDGADLNGKLIVEEAAGRLGGGTLMIKAGTTLPAYGDADTGYTEVEAGDTVSADSILAFVVDGKIVAATLLDVA